MEYEAPKLYWIINRTTRQEVRVTADNAQEACQALGWMIGDCYVRVMLNPASQVGSTIHQN